MSINYTLIELLEGPKRITSVSHDTIFEYAEEAMQDDVRFNDFMDVLFKNARWAFYGLVIAASDMVPVKKLFGVRADEVVIGKYHRSSVSEEAVFSKLLGFFGQGLYYNDDKVEFMLRYASEALTEDELTFFLDCIRQRDHDELFAAFRKYYENGSLDSRYHEYFSFGMNHVAELYDDVTKHGFAVTNWKKYVRVGIMYYDGDTVVDRKEADHWNRLIKKTYLPNICEIYIDIDTNEPFMVATSEGMMTFRASEEIDDFWIVQQMSEHKNMVIMTDQNNAVSVSSIENGKIEYITEACKSIRFFTIPLAILGKMINILSCKTESGVDINAFSPALSDKFSAGTELCFAKFMNTYYLMKG